MADSSFVYDGGPKWRPENALDHADRRGLSDADIVSELNGLRAALVPASKQWIFDRLSILLTMFSVGRIPAASEDIALWMSESVRLLGDLPADILKFAVDEAVRTRTHGFMPSVGEIRSIADPMTVERQMHIERLKRMEAALSDPVATAERTERRRVAEITARHHEAMSK